MSMKVANQEITFYKLQNNARSSKQVKITIVFILSTCKSSTYALHRKTKKKHTHKQ